MKRQALILLQDLGAFSLVKYQIARVQKTCLPQKSLGYADETFKYPKLNRHSKNLEYICDIIDTFLQKAVNNTSTGESSTVIMNQQNTKGGKNGKLTS